MKQFILMSLLLSLLGLSGQASALPIITLNPHSTTVSQGGNLFVDVNVSGLQSSGTNSLLGAFSLDVVFTPELQFLPSANGTTTFGNSLGDVNLGEADVGAVPWVPGSGIFSFYEVSLLEGTLANCIFCTGPYLESLQGDSFRLATLAFYLPYNTLPSGAPISLSTANVVLSDGFGDSLATGNNPSATVSVSEPPTFLLLGIALAFFGYSSQKLRFIVKTKMFGERIDAHEFFSRPRKLSKETITKPLRLLVSLGLLSCVVLPGHAEVFNVTSTNGVGDVVGLIQAINQANNVTPEPDTINLATGNYTLINPAENTAYYGSNGLPSINSTITINGHNTVIERDNNASAFRIMQIGGNGKLSLNQVTIQNAKTQDIGSLDFLGAIFNQGEIILSNCILANNIGGGLVNLNSGKATITNTRFLNNSGRGGAILNETGIMTILNSTITSNHSIRDGGGILNRANLTIENSTIDNNDGTNAGGLANGSGGVSTIINSTISGNRATGNLGDGGGLSNYNTVTLINSTIANNVAGRFGGGIWNYAPFVGDTATVKLINTLIADNLGSASVYNPPVKDDCTNNDEVIKGNNSIIEDGGCSAVANGFLTGDSFLAPLADNGGSTQTHRLLQGSIAIDAGNNTDCPTRDQRGAARPQDGDKNGVFICDIGAYEVGILTDLDKAQINGDAQKIGPMLRLTPDEPSKAGSAFLPTPFALSPNSIIHTHFTFQISGVNLDSDQRSDGLAFVIQNDPRGASALGNGGEGLGYGFNDTGGNPVNTITPSVAIEFDTHQNSFPLRNSNDPDGNHVALIINGEVNNHLAFNSPSFSLNNGTSRFVWIDYVGVSKKLEVFLATENTKPATPAISTTLDLAATVGNKAFFGFSAGTGEGFNSHDILAWNLNVVSSPTQGDFNGDSCIDQADLSAILAVINGPGPKPLVYDLNGDGKVNIADSRKLVTLFTNPRGAACH